MNKYPYQTNMMYKLGNYKMNKSTCKTNMMLLLANWSKKFKSNNNM